MAGKQILVDTGPVVALLRPDDAQHNVCVEQAKGLAYPLLTPGPS